MVKKFSASLVAALLLVNVSYGAEVRVNRYVCERVEYRIDYAKDKQRQGNKAKRPDLLNSRMRKLKQQLAVCKELGLLE